jgi:hypothetical protein
VAQNYGPLGCAARLRIECPFIRGKFPRHTRLLETRLPENIQMDRENQNFCQTSVQ